MKAAVIDYGAGNLRSIVKALDYAYYKNASIIGIVSRNGGYTKVMSDACILIPVVNTYLITPHAEGWQGIVWHLIVNALKEEE